MSIGLAADFLYEGVNNDSIVVVSELDIVENITVIEVIKSGFHMRVKGGEADRGGFEELLCPTELFMNESELFCYL